MDMYLIRTTDMIFDKKLKLWRMKRKYGKFNRPVGKTTQPPGDIVQSLKTPIIDISINQLQLFATND